MVDWWSLGVIMFECVVGFAPFHAKDPLETCRKIVRYERYFKVPVSVKISKPALDLMKRLVCPAHRRIGIEEIKKHQWFEGLDFDALQKRTPPFVPKLTNPTDAQYFEPVTAEQDLTHPLEHEAVPYHGLDNRVWGYTFNRAEAEHVRNMLKQGTQGNSNAKKIERSETPDQHS